MLFGTIAMSLFFVEKRSKGSLEAEVDLVKGQLRERDAELKALRQQLEQEQKRSADLEFYKKKLDEAGREQLKLERALEMKDGQMESFMSVATRQIKMLEGVVKEQEASIKQLAGKP